MLEPEVIILWYDSVAEVDVLDGGGRGTTAGGEEGAKGILVLSCMNLSM